MTIHDHVSTARDRLVQAGISTNTASIDAEILARHVLGWDKPTYLSNRHVLAPHSFDALYQSLLIRRGRREPVSFIVGYREFWRLNFEVTKDVLIPRPETELIVEETIAIIREQRFTNTVSIVDAGTGCGCLAIALAVEFPSSKITATDISPSALKVAKRNALKHGVADRITWMETNFLQSVDFEPDLIVSNPPYVPTASAPALSPEVRDYEPSVALLGGIDGLDGMRELFVQAESKLRRGGWLIVEFGFGQELAFRGLLDAHPSLDVVRIRNDLQGIARTSVIQRVNHR